MRSNSGTVRKNSSSSSGVQKPMTRSTPARLYQVRSNSTISPAVGRCGDVALEIPLVALALGRRGQGDDAADARIEPLGDALDGAALAGGVAAFEQHDDLELLVLHPILQPHQFVLQPEQLAEIDLAFERRFGRLRHALGDQLVEPVFLHLHFQLLVEAVGDFRLDAVELVDHWSHIPVGRRHRSRVS